MRENITVRIRVTGYETLLSCILRCASALRVTKLCCRVYYGAHPRYGLRNFAVVYITVRIRVTGYETLLSCILRNKITILLKIAH